MIDVVVEVGEGAEGVEEELRAVGAAIILISGRFFFLRRRGKKKT